MTIVVDINFISDDYPNQAKAFSVNIYAAQAFDIKNYSGDKNLVHMNGQTPSGFLNP